MGVWPGSRLVRHCFAYLRAVQPVSVSPREPRRSRIHFASESIQAEGGFALENLGRDEFISSHLCTAAVGQKLTGGG